ncbi:MAG: alpha/beta hydrolase [Deltaproteobacteria bacterium]|nr:alpha/beta hydrolase [Deltaproteobacteria bacterium]
MLLLWIAGVSVVVTVLALLPPRRFTVPAALTFFLTLPFVEFAPLVLLGDAVVLALLVPEALFTLPLWEVLLACAAMIASSLVLLWHYLRGAPVGAPFDERWRHFWPLVWSGYGVVQTRGVVFDPERKLRLDVFAPVDTAKKCAAIIYVHGGGWIVGYRSFQGRPFMVRMAQKGFVCFAPDYRLSPRATFPDHIVDVKRAIAWVREHAEEYNVDPEQILIAGNSAGGHLAALAALTPGFAKFQPGFEGARTDVLACLCFYGIYDLTAGRWPHGGLELLWRFLVIKQKRESAPELWRLASPSAHVGEHGTVPPFWLVHGTHDTLVPILEARAFSQRLQEVTKVELLEITGAQHAFELGISPRSRRALQAAEKFALGVVTAYEAVMEGRSRTRSRA